MRPDSESPQSGLAFNPEAIRAQAALAGAAASALDCEPSRSAGALAELEARIGGWEGQMALLEAQARLARCARGVAMLAKAFEDAPGVEALTGWPESPSRWEVELKVSLPGRAEWVGLDKAERGPDGQWREAPPSFRGGGRSARIGRSIHDERAPFAEAVSLIAANADQPWEGSSGSLAAMRGAAFELAQELGMDWLMPWAQAGAVASAAPSPAAGAARMGRL